MHDTTAMARAIVRLAGQSWRKPPQHAPMEPTAPRPAPLPEAPCSVTVRLVIEECEVQLTLRGHDEQAVLARLHAILTQYPPRNRD